MNENIKSTIKAKSEQYFNKYTLRRAGKKLIFVLLKSPYVIQMTLYYNPKHRTKKIWGRNLMIKQSSQKLISPY